MLLWQQQEDIFFLYGQPDARVLLVTENVQGDAFAESAKTKILTLDRIGKWLTHNVHAVKMFIRKNKTTQLVQTSMDSGNQGACAIQMARGAQNHALALIVVTVLVKIPFQLNKRVEKRWGENTQVFQATSENAATNFCNQETAKSAKVLGEEWSPFLLLYASTFCQICLLIPQRIMWQFCITLWWVTTAQIKPMVTLDAKQNFKYNAKYNILLQIKI